MKRNIFVVKCLIRLIIFEAIFIDLERFGGMHRNLNFPLKIKSKQIIQNHQK